VFDVPSEIDKYLGYNRGYSFDYDVPPPLPPASRYCGARAICASGGAGAGVASAVSGSNDTVVNMASDEDEDAIELDEAEDEYDDMFSPTTTTDDGLASPTFDATRIGHHHHQHVHGCPVDQRLRHDPAMQTIQDAKFIAQHVKNQDKFDEASFPFVLPVYPHTHMFFILPTNGHCSIRFERVVENKKYINIFLNNVAIGEEKRIFEKLRLPTYTNDE